MRKHNPFAVEYDSASYYLTGKYVGGHVSLELDARLRLLALWQGRSSQKVVKDALEDYIQRSEDDLTESLARKAFKEWRRRREHFHPSHVKREWYDFIDEVRSSLRRRKVREEHVNDIETKLKRLVNEEKKQ